MQLDPGMHRHTPYTGASADLDLQSKEKCLTSRPAEVNIARCLNCRCCGRGYLCTLPLRAIGWTCVQTSLRASVAVTGTRAQGECKHAKAMEINLEQ
eukprot:6173350-Pleurochrysis_carterae.AAC.4